MTYYQECMDADDRIVAYLKLISLFRVWCLKNTKHQETARIVDVMSEREKAYFPVHIPTKTGTCYQVVMFSSLQEFLVSYFDLEAEIMWKLSLLSSAPVETFGLGM